MQHLDEGTIHAWLDGALDAEESARVERHAAECATCAAAVAEARGLAAGASRILGALDHVPGGVLPRADRESLGSARASGSLWRMLHFTPARAAAAAILIVAAGTVLVVRHAPDEALRPEAAASTSPVIAADSTAASPASPTSPRAMPAPSVPRMPMPRTGAPQRTLQKAAPRATAKAEAAPPAATGGVAGAEVHANAARLAMTPLPARTDWSGCYEVVADSSAGLPTSIALETTRVAGYADNVRAADAAAVYAARPLGALERDSATAHSWWQPTPDGVRLFVSAQQGAIELHSTSPRTLSASKTVRDRQMQITLRRMPDCPSR